MSKVISQKNLKIILYGLLIIILLHFFLTLTSDIIIYTTGSTPLIGKTPTHTYIVNSFTKTKHKINEKTVVSKIQAKEMQDKINHELVKQTDSEILSYRPTIEIGDYIYYYGAYKNNEATYYKYNKETLKIEEIPNTSFSKDLNLFSEALLNYFPKLQGQINKLEGEYYGNAFYTNNRIFFTKFKDTGKEILYEYFPTKDKVKKITTINENRNLKEIFIK